MGKPDIERRQVEPLGQLDQRVMIGWTRRSGPGVGAIPRPAGLADLDQLARPADVRQILDAAGSVANVGRQPACPCPVSRAPAGRRSSRASCAAACSKRCDRRRPAAGLLGAGRPIIAAARELALLRATRRRRGRRSRRRCNRSSARTRGRKPRPTGSPIRPSLRRARYRRRGGHRRRGRRTK